MKAFLGGTCNGSKWRDALIPLLKIDYFNPVVSDWNEQAQERELRERATADFVLYAITPKMTGFYSIAEVADDSNKRPEKTLLVILSEDDGATFSEAQAKSLKAVGRLVEDNTGKTFYSLEEAARYVNGFALQSAAEAAGAETYWANR